MYTAVMASRPDGAFIDSALASISAQSLPAERCIVVLNGSADGLSAAAESLTRRNSHIHLVQSTKADLADAYCKALQLVDSPYVAFLDDDDEWTFDKQRIQVGYLESNPLVDAVLGSTVNFREGTEGIRDFGKPTSSRLFGAVTFRTGVFPTYGMPDSNAGHFAWLYRWWTMADRAGIRVERLDEVVLQRRIHENNSWVTDSEEGHRQLLTEIRRLHKGRSKG